MECGAFENEEGDTKKGVDAESNTTHSGKLNAQFLQTLPTLEHNATYVTWSSWAQVEKYFQRQRQF